MAFLGFVRVIGPRERRLVVVISRNRERDVCIHPFRLCPGHYQVDREFNSAVWRGSKMVDGR